MKTKDISLIASSLRYLSLEMTTQAGSGHLTSSLSAVELMAALFFAETELFRFDINNPQDVRNDRLIFSKGHASPLYYALWALADGFDMEELRTYRKFQSRLEGHPTRLFPYTEVPTGSLGQGLGAGVGMALGLKYLYTWSSREDLPRVFVLLGDSELSEGSVWEAAQIASYYKLSNICAVIDVNRLGQRGETMSGWNLELIAKKMEAFGWRTIVVEDGHDVEKVIHAYNDASSFYSDNTPDNYPVAIIAKTIKGKGISFLENRNGWHGKALSLEEFNQAVLEIGNKTIELIRKDPVLPRCSQPKPSASLLMSSDTPNQNRILLIKGEKFAVRKVYGKILVDMVKDVPNLIALDAEVGNSTFVQEFQRVYPGRFFEMFIAEQNMVSVAVGLARTGWFPFVSTFGSFFSRAFDQIRMAAHAKVPIVFVGSHVGVSIGEDGVSQMALEDIAMMRTVFGSIVFYPSDAVSACAIFREVAKKASGVAYIRMTRAEVPIIYDANEVFSLGGSKVLYASENDALTIVAAGITVHEAIKAYDKLLREENISVRIIDLYSIKPVDAATLLKAARETGKIIVVEDHGEHGGIADAVREVIIGETVSFVSLAVRKTPPAGTPEELLDYEEIGSRSIIEHVLSLIPRT